MIGKIDVSLNDWIKLIVSGSAVNCCQAVERSAASTIQPACKEAMETGAEFILSLERGRICPERFQTEILYLQIIVCGERENRFKSSFRHP